LPKKKDESTNPNDEPEPRTQTVSPA